ncbi:MAG: SET domain-containing protein-lysine N-methyltransferase [Phycisphaerales bacterium]
MHEISTPDIVVRDTGTKKGRGVFATRGFGEGEVVELSPVVFANNKWNMLPEWFRRTVFNWKKIGGEHFEHAFALGYGSLYNSSRSPNMSYRADMVSQAIVFRALRRISAGDELTINYSSEGGQAHSDRDYWFERQGLQNLEDQEASPTPQTTRTQAAQVLSDCEQRE